MENKTQASKRGIIPSVVLTRGRSPDEIERNDQDIGNQRHGRHEFAELAGPPSPLEVLATIEDGRGIQKDGKDVLLDKGGCRESPGIVEETGGNEGQVGNEWRGLNAASGVIEFTPSGNVVE